MSIDRRPADYCAGQLRDLRGATDTTILLALLAAVQELDDTINDTHNAGLRARVPTAGDYNRLTMLVDLARSARVPERRPTV